MSKESVPQRVYCNSCQRETLHEVRARHRRHAESDAGDIWSDDTYEILECRGCEAVSFQHQNFFSEDMDHRRIESGEWEPYIRPTVEIYPPRLARRHPDWLDDIEDKEVCLLMGEVYTALQNGALRVATMGLRAALERMMINQVNDHGSFEKNLEEFVNAGHLAPKLKPAFEQALDTGSASAHRAFEPNEDVFSHVLEAVEGIVWQVFVLPSTAAAMKAATPSRPPRAR